MHVLLDVYFEHIGGLFTFLFSDVERLEMIMGFTTLLPTKLAQTSFDAEVRQPDVLLESMITSMGATNILERKVLPNLADIGDSSAGLICPFC